MDVLHWLISNHEQATQGMLPGIIPTVLIPLTALTVGLTSLAGLIAGWFGIKLKTEGPKQFLEVLLKKRVLFSMIALNLSVLGLVKAYQYTNTLPSFIWTIEAQSKKNAIASDLSYSDNLVRPSSGNRLSTSSEPKSLSLQKLAEVKIPVGAFRSGAASSSSLFYGSNDGHVYEINQSDLEIKRKFFVGTQVTPRPLIYKNKLYAGEGNHDTHHARIYAFDLKSGKFAGSYQTKGHTEGQPLIAEFDGEALMFIVSGVDGVHAVNPATMELKWQKTDGHTDATVAFEDGIIYSGSGIEKGKENDRRFASSYRFKDGETLWKTELPLSNWMHPIVGKNVVCYALGEIYFSSQVGLLHCLDKKSGAALFSIPFDAPLASLPFYVKDENQEFVFIADTKGKVCGIDLTKKEKMWCHSTTLKDEKVFSLASVEYDQKRDLIWYASPTQGLFAFQPLNGEILTQWLPEKKSDWGMSYGAVTIVGDEIFHMQMNGVLRKFSLEH